MMDPRIYRAAFLPVIAAVVVLMFSLQPAPDPAEGPVSTPTFPGSETARLARSLVKLAPERPPGSEGDQALADRVRESFTGIPGGEVSTQELDSSFEGEEVDLQNVILTLPGQSEEILLVIAERDAPENEGATTSAAATATLIMLANELGESRRERTIVLASTSGGSTGSSGVRELVDQLPAPSGIEAAIAISAPGVADARPPHVFAGRSDSSSGPAFLLATAAEIAAVQFDGEASSSSPWDELSRLAVPVGLGAGAALEEEGVDAVTISGAGERGPAASADVPEAISAETLLASGSTVLDLLLTLDEPGGTAESAPGSYLSVGSNLLPGWTLRLLALALIAPGLAAAGDALLRERRRNPKLTRKAVRWTLERVLLPLAALVAAYVLGILGLIPDPGFPYDPGRFAPGFGDAAAMCALALALVTAALLVRPMRTPLDAEPPTLAAAAGFACGIAIIGIWLANPFMALLLAPAAHVWLLPARVQAPARARVVVVAVAIALIPILAASATVAADLDLGAAAPWHLLLLVESGQIGLSTSLLWCLLLGGLLACVAATGGRVAAGARELRGPRGYSGPGSLGGTPSSIPRS